MEWLSLANLLQVVVGLGLLNVWLLRGRSATPYRGGASRTLREHTPQAIQAMVDRIFDARLRDGQLSDAPLTMRELNSLRQSFASTLGSLLHSRATNSFRHQPPHTHHGQHRRAEHVAQGVCGGMDPAW